METGGPGMGAGDQISGPGAGSRITQTPQYIMYKLLWDIQFAQ